MDNFTKKLEIQSLSARPSCCWESRRRCVAHETFQERHSETVSQRSPEQLKQMKQTNQKDKREMAPHNSEKVTQVSRSLKIPIYNLSQAVKFVHPLQTECAQTFLAHQLMWRCKFSLKKKRKKKV